MNALLAIARCDSGGLPWACLVLLLVAAVYPRPLEAAPGPVPVVDLHVDLPYRSGYAGGTFARGSGEFLADSLVDAGVVGVVLPLYVPLDAKPHGRSEYQLKASYARVFRQILETPPYSLPGCDVHRAGSSSRPVSTWLAFEAAGAVAPTEQAIRPWVLRGVRSFGLVHSVPNLLADSSGRAGGSGGLTARGRRFVKTVARVGGVVDVSHASDRATDETIALSRRLGISVVATHSNARALAAHPRNLTDDQIRGIAASGGVVGVNFHQRFLSPGSGKATMNDVVEQIRYLVRLGGIEVVAIGSDYEGGIRPVSELADSSRFQRLAQALQRAGFSLEEVRQMLSENALRVLCPQN